MRFKHCRTRQGQSLLEYSVLLCVVLSALLIMQIYIKRCYQGRIKQEVDGVGQQYSPGHTKSLVITNTTSRSEVYSGGIISPAHSKVYAGHSAVTVDDGVTVTMSKTNSTYVKGEAVDSFVRD